MTPQQLYGDLLRRRTSPEARRFRFGRGEMQIHFALSEPPRLAGRRAARPHGDRPPDAGSRRRLARGERGRARAAARRGDRRRRPADGGRPVARAGGPLDPLGPAPGGAVAAEGRRRRRARYRRRHVDRGAARALRRPDPGADRRACAELRVVDPPARRRSRPPTSTPRTRTCPAATSTPARARSTRTSSGGRGPGCPATARRVDGLWHIGASTHPGPGARRRLGHARREGAAAADARRADAHGEINTIREVSAPTAYETLRTKLGEIHDIVKSASLLGWDQQVLMPSRGAEARAYQLGTLGKLAHELFVSDEIGSLLEELRSVRGEPRLRLARREPDPRRAPRLREGGSRAARAVGGDHARRARSRFGVWVEARANSDYESFRPWLEQLVELKHRYVECYPPADELYDTLLDDYEQGMKAADVRAIFDRLKEVLIPLVEAAAPAATPQVKGTFPARRPATAVARDREALRLRRDRLAARHRAAPVRAVARDAGHPHHDARAGGLARRALRRDARVRPRPVRGRRRSGVRAHAARARRVARPARVAVATVGEPRRPLAPVLELVLSAPAGDVPRSARLGRRGDGGSARSTTYAAG